MAAHFETHLARLEAAVDGEFAERWRYEPMTAAPGGGIRSADASRAVYEFDAVYDDDAFDSRALGSVERTASRITLRHVHIWARVSAFQGSPRRLDRLVRLKDGSRYELAEITQDHAGRFMLRVTFVAGAT